MADLVPLARLVEQNRWWIERNALKEDRDVTRFENSLVKWVPRIIYQFKLDSKGIYTLRGPRQVGKTTLLKLMIMRTLESGIDPRRVFYWSCDLVEGAGELARLVESYLRMDVEPGGRLILLDEVSSVRDWQKGVKHLKDTGLLDDSTLILTGSHSMDIKSAAERLPGRRGVSGGGPFDKIMLPMKFSEYVESRESGLASVIDGLDLRRIESRWRVLRDLLDNGTSREVETLLLHEAYLSKLLEDYLITGGLPRAIDDFLSDGVISQDTYSVYVEALRGDVRRSVRHEMYGVQLLRRLIEISGSQVSWRTIMNGTDIGSVNTVADYLDTFVASYIVNQLFTVNPNTKVPIYGKEKKILFRDPFIFHSIRGWVNQSQPFNQALAFNSSDQVGRLVEGIVCDHVVRLSYDLNPSDIFKPTENVMYWKGEKGEVDLVLKTPTGLMPIEVKWSKGISNRELKGLRSFQRITNGSRGMIVTRDSTMKVEDDYVILPVSLFLLLT